MINGTWSTGSPIDLGFLAFSVLCGAAALSESMCRVASAGYARHQLGPVRLTMVATGLLVAPTVLLVQATEGPVTTGVAIAVVTAAVGILMLVRLSLSARAYRVRADREHAVRVASRQLVTATTDTDVVAAVQDALRGMLAGGPAQVRLAESKANEDAVAMVPRPPDGVIADLRVALDHSSSASTLSTLPRRMVFTARTVELAELTAVLEGLTDQAGSALRRFLRSAHCHYGQGFYYAPAMPIDDAVAWRSHRASNEPMIEPATGPSGVSGAH